MRDTVGTVYLLHFDRWLGVPGKGGARHYMGWARAGCLEERLKRHRQARTPVGVLRELHRRGGDFVLARTWPGETPEDEKRRKRNGHISALCPVCRGRWPEPEEG